MYNDVIELGKSVIKTDDYGNQFKDYEFREVFADVRSVSQSEYYTAAQTGLKPSFKMVLADYYDYEEEETVRYNGQLYKVIRTYRSKTELELTVERRIEGDGNE